MKAALLSDMAGSIQQFLPHEDIAGIWYNMKVVQHVCGMPHTKQNTAG